MYEVSNIYISWIVWIMAWHFCVNSTQMRCESIKLSHYQCDSLTLLFDNSNKLDKDITSNYIISLLKGEKNEK